MIDARLVPDEQEDITPGEAVAGMILNGLGFANRPLFLTPQFFTQKPLDLLFRQGVRAEMFNRFKLGRTLDEVHTKVFHMCWASQRACPNSYRLMKSPITRSCICSVLEKQIVRRINRLIRVRRLICLLSIFCVFSLPT